MDETTLPPCLRVQVLANSGYRISADQPVSVVLATSRGERRTLCEAIGTSDGAVILCRCGQSYVLPGCDNSCAQSGFHDTTSSGGGRIDDTDEEAPLIALIKDGPIMAVRAIITQVDGSTVDLTNAEGALCRCGASRTKPWCDFSHCRIGWTSDKH